MVVHSCNPSYWEAKIRKIMVPSQLRQKVHENPIPANTTYVWWCAPVIPVMPWLKW
jgi:hypothetical protein